MGVVGMRTNFRGRKEKSNMASDREGALRVFSDGCAVPPSSLTQHTTAFTRRAIPRVFTRGRPEV